MGNDGIVDGRLSPGSGGELRDPDGNDWTLVRGPLDPRTVRSRFRRSDVPVLFGRSGGFDINWVAADTRLALWAEIKDGLWRPPGEEPGLDSTYVGFEFADGDGTKALYIEEYC